MTAEDDTTETLREQLRNAQAALESCRQDTSSQHLLAERKHLLRQVDVLSHLLHMSPTH